jgi:hypothetical protein
MQYWSPLPTLIIIDTKLVVSVAIETLLIISNEYQLTSDVTEVWAFQLSL